MYFWFVNCSTILWVSVSQGQLLGNMSPTEVCGSLTKTVKPSLIWAPLSDGSRPWGEGGWSSRPWYKGLGRGLEKKILAHLASVCSRSEGSCPLPSGICHCLYEMNSSVTNIHVISKVPKPKQFYLCNADITPSPFGIQQWAPRLSCLAEKI